jgi:hypothetical protein
MSAPEIERIILGHNPFFGVDHLSQERGNEKAKQFEDPGLIVDVLKECNGLGVRGLMMSTHPHAASVAAGMQREPSLSEWRLYPLIPYVNKYVRGANEKGLVNLAIDVLSQASIGQKLRMVLQGGRGLLGKDFRQAVSLLLDVELVPFRRVPLGAVFLHDALTDLALGLGLDSVLELFRDHVTRHYGVPAGLATKNLPLLRERLERLGWSEPLVMASFNRAGFYMNPSADLCAEAVRCPGVCFVAMNTLAGGYLKPDAAYSFLAQFPTVCSIVVGISRKDHAVETIEAIRHHMRR